jgi:hypothetical protein
MKDYIIYKLTIEGSWEECKAHEHEVEDVIHDSLETLDTLSLFIFRAFLKTRSASLKKCSYECLMFAYMNPDGKFIVLEPCVRSRPYKKITHLALEKLLKKQISRGSKIYLEARNLGFL